MDKIIKISRCFKRVFTVIFVGWPIVLAVIWFGPQQGGFLVNIGLTINNFIPAGLSEHILVPLSGMTKVWGFLISFIPMAIAMVICGYFIQLFKGYAQGEIFTLPSIRYLKKIAITMIVGVVINPIYQSLITMAMTWHNPVGVGQRMIQISVGAGAFRNLITAGLIFLIAYMMQECLKLREEQALTV